MSKAGKEIVAGLEEALRFARGEETGARVTVIEIPDVPAIRAKLGLTQDEFARRFGVSLGTLRNWEQGARAPEGPARVLLTVIDKEPEAVRRALKLAAAGARKPSKAKKTARKRA
jgi:putative transcriptional regulator